MKSLIFIAIIILSILFIYLKTKKIKEGLSGGMLYSNNPYYTTLSSTDRYENSMSSTIATFVPTLSDASSSSFTVSFYTFNNLFIGDLLNINRQTGTLLTKILPTSINNNNFIITTSPTINTSGIIEVNSERYLSHVFIKRITNEFLSLGTFYGRGSGTIISQTQVLTAAHVVEPKNVETNSTIINAYKKAVDASSNYVIFKYDVSVYFNPDKTQTHLNMDTFYTLNTNWIPARWIVIPADRYTLTGNTLTCSTLFDLAIIILDHPIPTQIAPVYDLSGYNIRASVSSQILPVEMRGAIEKENRSSQTKIIPFNNTNKVCNPGYSNYIIMNGPTDIVLTTGNIRDGSYCPIPYSAQPIFFQRSLTSEDIKDGSIDLYGVGTVTFYFDIKFDHNITDGSGSYQYIGIGSAYEIHAIGFIGDRFGIIRMVNGIPTLIETLKKTPTNNKYYRYEFQFTRNAGKNDLVIGYFDPESILKWATKSKKITTEDPDLPHPDLYICINTVQSKSKPSNAVPLSIMVSCKKIFYNRGNFYVNAFKPNVGDIFDEKFLDKLKKIEQDEKTLINTAIPTDTMIYGSDSCNWLGTACNNIPGKQKGQILEGPLPITDSIQGDSGGGVFVYDTLTNQMVLIGILVIGESADFPSLIYATSRYCGIVCIYNFIDWITNIPVS